MSFSDSDLKMLKEILESNDVAKQYTSIKTMKALFIRLEAAEKIAAAAQGVTSQKYFGKGSVGFNRLNRLRIELEAWRTVCGK